MSVTYTPALVDALGDAMLVRDRVDASDLAYNGKIMDAKNFAKPVEDEVLSLIGGRLASGTFRQQFTCGASDAVGDAVYHSAANTVAKADATTTTKAKLAGFISHKGNRGATSSPTATTCYLDTVRYVSGLTGLTPGDPVYLTDAGGFGASAGTVAVVAGLAISTTEALLWAGPLGALGLNRLLTWSSSLLTMLFRSIQAKTEADSPYTLQQTDNNTRITNNGAAAEVEIIIPASTLATPWRAKFSLMANQNLKIAPASGVTLYFGGNFVKVGASGHYIMANQIGCNVTIDCLAPNHFEVEAAAGDWNKT